ncbi:hypothetical protein BJX96DRAFT_159979 [Aspergillus floccosus]
MGLPALLAYASMDGQNSPLNSLDPPNGFFARYAVCNGPPSEPLFVTPITHPSSEATHLGDYPSPRLSLFPAPCVLDLSPDDVGLAAGFALAGCRIRAAIGPCPQTWKDRFPDATVYGDLLSMADARDPAAEILLSDGGDGQAPRICTISGWTNPPHVQGASGPSDSSTLERLLPDIYPLQLCGLAALSPTLSPDFLVLVLPDTDAERLRGPLVDTVTLLLGASFSIYLRNLSLPKLPSEAQPVTLLLAVPRGTKPQWIGTAFADLGLEHARARGGADGDEDSPTQATEHSDEAAKLVKPADSAGSDAAPAGVLAGVPVGVAHRVAVVIARITGEFAKRENPTVSPALLESSDGEGPVKRLKV